ncbi:CCR4-NOT transcription complex subunit 11, variant 3 [Basidiobolus ranarum]
MCEDAKKEQNTCQLLAKAYEEPLSMVEQQLILQEFENDVKFVYRSGLTPDNLSALVENNPTIVIEALIQLSKCKEMAEYLNALSDITTLHSLEVVNRLTTSCEIPQEFLHQYLERHISSCDSMTDRNVQNRQVRLVCVFVQSLLRNKVIELSEFVIELQPFLVQYSRVKEAAELYKYCSKINLP